MAKFFLMDLEEQENELLALQSILDPDSFTLEKSSGEIKIHPNLTLVVSIETTSDGGSTQDHKVQHLPPFVLSFTFPSSYPSILPPTYTLSCIWLSKYQVCTMYIKSF